MTEKGLPAGNVIGIVFIILIAILFIGGGTAGFAVFNQISKIPAWGWILFVLLLLIWLWRKK